MVTGSPFGHPPIRTVSVQPQLASCVLPLARSMLSIAMSMLQPWGMELKSMLWDMTACDHMNRMCNRNE